MILDLEVERDIEQARRCAANVLITGGDARMRRAVAERIHEQRGRPAAMLVLGERGNWNDTDLLKSLSLGATIFIEEVSALDDCQQTALLRVLDRRIEGTSQRAAGCRIISGSAGSVYDLVARGEFHADLFYRLNVIHIVISRCGAR